MSGILLPGHWTWKSQTKTSPLLEFLPSLLDLDERTTFQGLASAHFFFFFSTPMLRHVFVIAHGFATTLYQQVTYAEETTC